MAIAGALVQLDGSPVRTTQSDSLGQFRFDNVGGLAVLRVSKDEYVDVAQTVRVTADQTATFTLRRMLLLLVGTPLRATVKEPPCDPSWDSQAPCLLLSFIPPATGSYELVLRWDGPEALDLLLDGGDYSGPTAPGEIRITVPGQAGVRREIRIHSYYGPQAFELSVLPK